jgi:hypothetical protein
MCTFEHWVEIKEMCTFEHWVEIKEMCTFEHWIEIKEMCIFEHWVEIKEVMDYRNSRTGKLHNRVLLSIENGTLSFSRR